MTELGSFERDLIERIDLPMRSNTKGNVITSEGGRSSLIYEFTVGPLGESSLLPLVDGETPVSVLDKTAREIIARVYGVNFSQPISPGNVLMQAPEGRSIATLLFTTKKPYHFIRETTILDSEIQSITRRIESVATNDIYQTLEERTKSELVAHEAKNS